jgi:hypothetical protein
MLFFQAPITIFLIDGILQMVSISIFMFIMFGEDRSADGMRPLENEV